MKQVMFIITSLLLAASFLLASCSEQIDSCPTPMVVDEAANPENPYDNVGKLHNLGLTAIANHPRFLLLTDEEAYNVATQAIFEASGIPFVPYNQIQHFAFYGTNKMVEDSSMQTNNVLSPTVTEKFMEMEDIVRCKGVDTTLTDTSDVAVITSYTKFHDEMVKFESGILNDSNLSTNDKQQVLGSASVARYSCAYWTIEVPKDPTNNWNQVLETNLTTGRTSGWWGNVWGWIKQNVAGVIATTAGDAIGFIGSGGNVGNAANASQKVAKYVKWQK